MTDPLVIAGKAFRSRLMVGTGKYPDAETMRRAIEASGAEIVTVALRRIDLDEGFVVLPYIPADPELAKRLEAIGCATVMPLAAPIGTGQGFAVGVEPIRIIVEQANVPVVVDAGLGAPSEAALAMEIGCDAVLVNTAIAKAKDPVQMAEAFKLGVEAGRMAYRAGRIPKLPYASASSPLEGVVRG